MAEKSGTVVEKQVIKVAIIEDFKLTRVGLRCALNENNDMNVVAEAEDAIEGLKLIERSKPDVILMDLGLPGMKYGTEGCRRATAGRGRSNHYDHPSLQRPGISRLLSFRFGPQLQCQRAVRSGAVQSGYGAVHEAV